MPVEEGGKDGGAGSWAELVSSRYGRLTLAGCGLFFIQQFAGINAVVYFSSDVFRHAGLQSAALGSAAVGLTNVAFTACAGMLLDRFGRKPLLGGSFAGMGAAMALLAAALALPQLQPWAGPLALAGTLAYVASFAMGAGPVPALLISELFPARLRGKAQAAAMGAHWVSNFFIGQTFLSAVAAVGVARVYAAFAAVCFCGVLFVRVLVPETRAEGAPVQVNEDTATQAA